MSRRPLNPKFRQQVKEPATGVHPAMIKQARKSGQLNLSNRQLSEVPSSVWRINIDAPEEGKDVSLDNAEDRWWDQVGLTKLILASNLLTELADDILQLHALIVLDVHDNHLKAIPAEIGELMHLQRLNISHNEVTELPDTICALFGLQTLHVQHNKLTQLTSQLANLKSLEDLDISNNQLTALPQGIGQLERLVKFNMSHNHIHVIPHEIGCLSNLAILDCTHNQIHSLPDELGNCSKLEQLYLRHNRLTHLPLLNSCATIKELHLGNNNLQEITAEHLEGLKNVSVLDLRDNRIAKIPDEITVLHQLERLDLTNNDLSGLPYNLGSIVSLKSIVLDGNPMKGIRRDVIMRGTQELKKYLLSRIAESECTAPKPVVELRGAQSGVFGTSSDTIDAHAVASSKTLDYSEKKAQEIPGELWDVAEQGGVTCVNFNKNLLTQVPNKLVSLKKTLTELSLGFNKLKELDSCIGTLQNLLMLDLRNNELCRLPDELAQLTALRELIIPCNRFRVLPPIVYKLAKVEVILASDNQIEAIDASGLIQLTELASLDLRNNSVTQVPPVLGLCTQIRSLQLEGNAFRVPRAAIVSKGTLAVLDYLRGRIPHD